MTKQIQQSGQTVHTESEREGKYLTFFLNGKHLEKKFSHRIIESTFKF